MKRIWDRALDWYFRWAVPPCPLTTQEWTTVYGPSRDRQLRGKARRRDRRTRA